MTMTNKDLIQSVSQKAALTKQATEQLLRQTAQIITQTLKEGGDVKIQHFGSLSVSAHKARTVTNPRNGKKTEVPAKEVWAFKANDKLKNAVNEPKGESKKPTVKSGKSKTTKSN